MRTSLSTQVKREVLERDGFRCVKCGRKKGLQIHHIFPVVKHGQIDLRFNLITLCEDCHSHAPDNPIEFIKYCARKLPDELTRSADISKYITAVILSEREKFTEELAQTINNRIDQLFYQLWDALSAFSENTPDAFDKFGNLVGQIKIPKETPLSKSRDNGK